MQPYIPTAYHSLTPTHKMKKNNNNKYKRVRERGGGGCWKRTPTFNLTPRTCTGTWICWGVTSHHCRWPRTRGTTQRLVTHNSSMICHRILKTWQCRISRAHITSRRHSIISRGHSTSKIRSNCTHGTSLVYLRNHIMESSLTLHGWHAILHKSISTRSLQREWNENQTINSITIRNIRNDKVWHNKKRKEWNRD